jgi:hypothetical protein
MLSGMSPGGLLSAGTGDSGGTGETRDRAGFGDRVPDGEGVVPLEDEPPAVAELPQALIRIAHVAIAATAVAVDRVGRMRAPPGLRRWFHPVYAAEREEPMRMAPATVDLSSISQEPMPHCRRRRGCGSWSWRTR